MTQKSFLTITSIIAALFGLGFLLMPDTALALYGTATNDAGRLAGRHFGAALIGFAIVLFAARDLTASPARTGVLWAGLSNSVLFLVLIFIATSGGVLNAMGWTTVALHAILGLGFAYFAFTGAGSR